MRKLFKEPLAQFLLLGAGLFLLWSAYGDNGVGGASRIVISPGQVQRVLEVFQKTRMRPPTEGEFQELIDQEIQAEVYYREGVALGLDRDDEIIRRRLKQKLGFLTQDIVEQTAPSEAVLQAFLDQHHENYGGAARFAFSHIYLDPGKHGDHLDADAAKLAASLNAGDGRLDYARLGDPLPVPNDFEALATHDIDRTFGIGFADELAKQPLGRWVGPVSSGYGRHLVLVRQHLEPTALGLDQVHDAVLRDWQTEERARVNAEAFGRMRAKYSVKVDLPKDLGK